MKLKNRILADEQCNMIILVWPFMYQKKPYWDQLLKTFNQLISILLGNKNHVVIITNDKIKTRKKVIENCRNNKLSNFEKNLYFFEYECNDIWIRDYGPIQIKSTNTQKYDFFEYKFNGYGKKYEFKKDDSFSNYFLKHFISNLFGIDFNSSSRPFGNLIIEGGNIQSNRDGLIIFNRKCLVRNNKENWMNIKSYFDNAVKENFISEYLFFDLDPITGDDTNGHLDNLIRIYDKNYIFYMHSNDIDHPDYYLLEDLKKQLNTVVTKTSKIKKIIPINHSVDDVVRDKEDNILPFSYLNYMITNNVIIFPGNKNTDMNKLTTLMPFFDQQKNYIIDIEGLLNESGGLHCCSLNICY